MLLLFAGVLGGLAGAGGGGAGVGGALAPPFPLRFLRRRFAWAATVLLVVGSLAGVRILADSETDLVVVPFSGMLAILFGLFVLETVLACLLRHSFWNTGHADELAVWAPPQFAQVGGSDLGRSHSWAGWFPPHRTQAIGLWQLWDEWRKVWQRWHWAGPFLPLHASNFTPLMQRNSVSLLSSTPISGIRWISAKKIHPGRPARARMGLMNTGWKPWLFSSTSMLSTGVSTGRPRIANFAFFSEGNP